MLGVLEVMRLDRLTDFKLASDATADTNDAGDIVPSSSSSSASDTDDCAAGAIPSGCRWWLIACCISLDDPGRLLNVSVASDLTEYVCSVREPVLADRDLPTSGRDSRTGESTVNCCWLDNVPSSGGLPERLDSSSSRSVSVNICVRLSHEDSRAFWRYFCRLGCVTLNDIKVLS